MLLFQCQYLMGVEHSSVDDYIGDVQKLSLAHKDEELEDRFEDIDGIRNDAKKILEDGVKVLSQREKATGLGLSFLNERYGEGVVPEEIKTDPYIRSLDGKLIGQNNEYEKLSTELKTKMGDTKYLNECSDFHLLIEVKQKILQANQAVITNIQKKIRYYSQAVEEEEQMVSEMEQNSGGGYESESIDGGTRVFNSANNQTVFERKTDEGVSNYAFGVGSNKPPIHDVLNLSGVSNGAIFKVNYAEVTNGAIKNKFGGGEVFGVVKENNGVRSMRVCDEEGAIANPPQRILIWEGLNMTKTADIAERMEEQEETEEQQQQEARLQAFDEIGDIVGLKQAGFKGFENSYTREGKTFTGKEVAEQCYNKIQDRIDYLISQCQAKGLRPAGVDNPTDLTSYDSAFSQTRVRGGHFEFHAESPSGGLIARDNEDDWGEVILTETNLGADPLGRLIYHLVDGEEGAFFQYITSEFAQKYKSQVLESDLVVSNRHKIKKFEQTITLNQGIDQEEVNISDDSTLDIARESEDDKNKVIQSMKSGFNRIAQGINQGTIEAPDSPTPFNAANMSRHNLVDFGESGTLNDVILFPKSNFSPELRQTLRVNDGRIARYMNKLRQENVWQSLYEKTTAKQDIEIQGFQSMFDEVKLTEGEPASLDKESIESKLGEAPSLGLVSEMNSLLNASNQEKKDFGSQSLGRQILLIQGYIENFIRINSPGHKDWDFNDRLSAGLLSVFTGGNGLLIQIAGDREGFDEEEKAKLQMLLDIMGKMVSEYGQLMEEAKGRSDGTINKGDGSEYDDGERAEYGNIYDEREDLYLQFFENKVGLIGGTGTERRSSDQLEDSVTMANVEQKKEQLNAEIPTILSLKGIDGAIEHLAHLHREIDKNNWQHRAVKELYLSHTQALGQAIFDKIKEDDLEAIPESSPLEYQFKETSEKQYLTLLQVLRADGVDVHGEKYQIDDNMRHFSLCDEVFGHIMQGGLKDDSRVGGLIDKMDIKPARIEDRREFPAIIARINQHSELDSFKGIFEGFTNDQGKTIFSEGIKYNDLSLEQRALIGSFVEYEKRFGSFDPTFVNPNNPEDTFATRFTGLMGKTLDEMFDTFDDRLKVSPNSAFGLIGTESDLLQQYKKYKGVIGISDERWHKTKEYTKVGATIVVAIGATIGACATAGAMGAAAGGARMAVAGAIGGIVGGQVGNILINQESYESIEEFAVDFGTEVATEVVITLATLGVGKVIGTVFKGILRSSSRLRRAFGKTPDLQFFNKGKTKAVIEAVSSGVIEMPASLALENWRQQTFFPGRGVNMDQLLNNMAVMGGVMMGFQIRNLHSAFSKKVAVRQLRSQIEEKTRLLEADGKNNPAADKMREELNEYQKALDSFEKRLDGSAPEATRNNQQVARAQEAHDIPDYVKDASGDDLTALKESTEQQIENNKTRIEELESMESLDNKQKEELSILKNEQSKLQQELEYIKVSYDFDTGLRSESGVSVGQKNYKLEFIPATGEVSGKKSKWKLTITDPDTNHPIIYTEKSEGPTLSQMGDGTNGRRIRQHIQEAKDSYIRQKRNEGSQPDMSTESTTNRREDLSERDVNQMSNNEIMNKEKQIKTKNEPLEVESAALREDLGNSQYIRESNNVVEVKEKKLAEVEVQIVKNILEGFLGATSTVKDLFSTVGKLITNASNFISESALGRITNLAKKIKNNTPDNPLLKDKVLGALQRLQNTLNNFIGPKEISIGNFTATRISRNKYKINAESKNGDTKYFAEAIFDKEGRFLSGKREVGGYQQTFENGNMTLYTKDGIVYKKDPTSEFFVSDKNISISDGTEIRIIYKGAKFNQKGELLEGEMTIKDGIFIGSFKSEATPNNGYIVNPYGNITYEYTGGTKNLISPDNNISSHHDLPISKIGDEYVCISDATLKGGSLAGERLLPGAKVNLNEQNQVASIEGTVIKDGAIEYTGTFDFAGNPQKCVIYKEGMMISKVEGGQYYPVQRPFDQYSSSAKSIELSTTSATPLSVNNYTKVGMTTGKDITMNFDKSNTGVAIKKTSQGYEIVVGSIERSRQKFIVKKPTLLDRSRYINGKKLDEPTLTIGRNSPPVTNDIPINDNSVSRESVVIGLGTNELQVLNRGNRNGVSLVGGNPQDVNHNPTTARQGESGRASTGRAGQQSQPHEGIPPNITRSTEVEADGSTFLKESYTSATLDVGTTTKTVIGNQSGYITRSSKEAYKINIGGKVYQIEKNLAGEINLDGTKLSKNELTIGREGENDIKITDSSISRDHLSIRFGDEGEIIIVDKGSKNGSRVYPSVAVRRPQSNFEYPFMVGSTIQYMYNGQMQRMNIEKIEADGSIIARHDVSNIEISADNVHQIVYLPAKNELPLAQVFGKRFTGDLTNDMAVNAFLAQDKPQNLLGDAFGDRVGGRYDSNKGITYSEAIAKKICESEGELCVGNHEIDFYVNILADGGKFSVRNFFSRNGKGQQQGRGVVDLLKYISKDKISIQEKQIIDFWLSKDSKNVEGKNSFNPNNIPGKNFSLNQAVRFIDKVFNDSGMKQDIRNNMKSNSEGKYIIQAFTEKSSLVSLDTSSGTLSGHLPPTPAVLDILTKVSIDELNSFYRKGITAKFEGTELDEKLVMGSESIGFKNLLHIFTHTMHGRDPLLSSGGGNSHHYITDHTQMVNYLSTISEKNGIGNNGLHYYVHGHDHMTTKIDSNGNQLDESTRTPNNVISIDTM